MEEELRCFDTSEVTFRLGLVTKSDVRLSAAALGEP